MLTYHALIPTAKRLVLRSIWIGAFAGWLLVPARVMAAQGASLPPEECVRLLRAARIARLADDAQTELTKIQAARATFPEEIAPMVALIDYQRRQGDAGEEAVQLRADLADRLRSPDTELPFGVLSYLVADPEQDRETLELLATYLTYRVGREGSGGLPTESTLDPLDPQLLELLADLQQRLGRTEAAAATRLRLWRQTGADGQLWTLIRDLRTLGRWSEVADHLITLVDGGTVGLRSDLLYALVQAERFDELLAQVDQLEGGLMPGLTTAPERGLSMNSSETWALLRALAWQSRDRGRDDVAEHLFRRVVALNGEDSEARAALLYLYGSAEEQASHAAAITQRWEAESDPQTLLNEGAQLLSTGDAQGAFDLLQRAAPSLPEEEAAWYNLGMAAYRLKEWQTVDEAFAKAALLNPQRAQSFYFRGIALVELSRCREAIEPLLAALELDAERTQGHYYLAGCYRELGDASEAERHRRLYEASR